MSEFPGYVQHECMMSQYLHSIRKEKVLSFTKELDLFTSRDFLPFADDISKCVYLENVWKARAVLTTPVVLLTLSIINNSKLVGPLFIT